MRALVVDDSKASRGILADMLRELGFEVIEAAGGREALDLLEQAPVDLALVDWVMPEMDGVELVRALRRENSLDGLRLIMVSTKAGREAVRSALASGVDEYIMKPVTREMVREKLEILGFPGIERLKEGGERTA